MSQEYRLPTDVVPKHYDLTIWTDIENARFEGVVHIALYIDKDTDKIVLNALDLELGEVFIQVDHSGTKEELKAVGKHLDRTAQRATFSFPKILDAGTEARLTIKFGATLTSSMSGYYRSAGGKDGKTAYSLTQFQPTAARKAFPCWDEPALKATFAITMVSHVNSGVNLSNMPAKSEETYHPGSSMGLGEESLVERKLSKTPTAADWKITRFETTPPISTYLVAYANGPFEYLESSYKSPLSGKIRPLRIYATEDMIGQGQYALDIMRDVMPLYEEVFDLEFSLPKLDILVPYDLDLGGMENWGLITGRAQCFLVDPNNSSLRVQQYVASMVSHEVGHMWFGDITTMEWWDNLYLNEGFATFVGEKIILDRLFPEWELDAQFLGSNFYRALALDAKLSSHPIEVECPDANKIIQIFDDLSYCKAASVLRMLATYVGEDRFLKGVSIYLHNHKYKNTVTKDLWQGIQAATSQDIPKMMDNWVKEMGYPVLTVTEKQEGILVRQDRFLETGPANPEDNQTIWTLPLNLLTVTPDGTAHVDSNILLAEREMFIPLDPGQPFKLNTGTTSFFIVQYSAARLAKLGQQAVSPDLPFTVQDRVGLVRDAFALARAGYAPVSGALGLVDALRDAEEYFVWDAIATSLADIAGTWWENPTVTEKFDAFRRSLFVPIVKRLGLDPSPFDSPGEEQLRVKAVQSAWEAGDTWVIDELKTRFAHFVKTGDDAKIPGALAGIAYRVGVREGGADEWRFVQRIAQEPRNPSQGVAAMTALGETRDLQLAAETFRYALEDARDQDVLYYINGLQRNTVTRRFVAERVLERFDEIEQRYAGTFAFNRWLENACGALTSQEDYHRLSAFFKDKDTATYELPLHQTLDTIHAHAEWLKRSTDELTHWLEDRKD